MTIKMAGGNKLAVVIVLAVAVMVGVVWPAESATGIGVNWGTLSLHRLSPSTVVDLLKDNKIHKVKLFDADPYVLKALTGTGIEVMVGIPNEMLALLSSSTAASDLWVRQNVSTYLVKGGVDIRFVSFLFWYSKHLLPNLISPVLLLLFCLR